MRQIASSGESIHSPKASLSGQGGEHPLLVISYVLTSTTADFHLQTLQSLAAHMKLLLDAPEHLWRLLERKLYLYAAWLFLLSRVVHRSLLREHDEDDATWVASGIDIGVSEPCVVR